MVQSEMRMIAALIVVQFMLLSFAAVPCRAAGPGLAAAAQAAAKQCADCGEDENASSAGALCSFKFIVYFLWYAVMAVVFVVAVVMDLGTGFTQDYTRDLADWFMEKNRELARFFRSLGCG